MLLSDQLSDRLLANLRQANDFAIISLLTSVLQIEEENEKKKTTKTVMTGSSIYGKYRFWFGEIEKINRNSIKMQKGLFC